MASTTTGNLDQNSRFLLLGASGQLGQMLRCFWNDPPHLALHSRQARPEFIQFDLILEPEKAIAAMAGIKAVICLPGVTPAQATSSGDLYSRNTDLALAAIRCAAKAGVGRVFLASSAAVYGAASGVQDETNTPGFDHHHGGSAKFDPQIAPEPGQIGHGAFVGEDCAVDALLDHAVLEGESAFFGFFEHDQILT